MMMPDIFGEKMFDSWMDFSFPGMDKVLYGKRISDDQRSQGPRQR